MQSELLKISVQVCTLLEATWLHQTFTFMYNWIKMLILLTLHLVMKVMNLTYLSSNWIFSNWANQHWQRSATNCVLFAKRDTPKIETVMSWIAGITFAWAVWKKKWRESNRKSSRILSLTNPKIIPNNFLKLQRSPAVHWSVQFVGRFRRWRAGERFYNDSELRD